MHFRVNCSVPGSVFGVVSRLVARCINSCRFFYNSFLFLCLSVVVSYFAMFFFLLFLQVRIVADEGGEFGHPLVRQSSVLALSKFMCISESFCERNLSLLFTTLERAKDIAVSLCRVSRYPLDHRSRIVEKPSIHRRDCPGGGRGGGQP